MIILQTERLDLCHMQLEDADFIVELLNSPGWLKHIGDRGIRTLEQAREYLSAKVLPDYQQIGFGFYLIIRRSDQIRVGNCGLVRRPGMEHVDIGYSLLQDYEGQGYAYEAARSMLEYGFQKLGLKIIDAITTESNERSQHLLKKLGMSYKKTIRLPDDDEELMLYRITAFEEDKGS